jgi:hypothetical protein
MSGLRVIDMVQGLERFADSYDALDVFVKDVDLAQVKEDIIVEGGRRYRLELKPEFGVLRLRRDESGGTSGPLLGALVGAGWAALANKKPETIVGATVLGMLVGAVILPDEPQSPRKVLTMRFDPRERTWRAYSGSLVPTMKEQLGRAV